MPKNKSCNLFSITLRAQICEYIHMQNPNLSFFSADIVNDRKARLEKQWNTLLQPTDAVLIYSGDPITKPGGLDQIYPFLPHPSYFWLTGRRRPSEVIVYSPRVGWSHFLNPVSTDEVVWEGGTPEADPVSSHQEFLFSKLTVFLQKNSFSNMICLGEAPSATVNKASELFFEIKKRMDSVRRIKDAHEVQLIRSIAQIANQGFQALDQILQNFDEHKGLTEKDLQAMYESAVLRAGSERMPYDTIIGSGVNAATLHAIPTDKKIKNGEFVLVDAGADIKDYCVDVTRTYYAASKSAPMTSQHRSLYDLVAQAQKSAIDLCLVGQQWNKVHEASARHIAQGLKDLNIFTGTVDEALDSEAISVFYPHGVGHLVGLRVRDTGHEENLNPKRYFGARLRVDLTLQENMLLTVEPGCYFIPALLQSAQVRDKFKNQINWVEVERWQHIGGVRIEDDVLIKNNKEAEILTDCIHKK